MLIGNRIRLLREHKKLSQGDIQARTGLLRCYISRIENGHTVPAIETLEKFARALEVPLYAIFLSAEEDSREPVEPRDPATRQTRRILEALGRVTPRERELLFLLAKAFAARREGNSRG